MGLLLGIRIYSMHSLPRGKGNDPRTDCKDSYSCITCEYLVERIASKPPPGMETTEFRFLRSDDIIAPLASAVRNKGMERIIVWLGT